MPLDRESATVVESSAPDLSQNQRSSGTGLPDDFIQNFMIAVDFQDPVEVRSDSRLDALPEWDSLAALGVIVMFDMEYSLTISGNDLKNCATIADLYDLIVKKRR